MNKYVRGGLVALIWLGVWQGLALIVRLPLLLPGPGDTLAALIRLAGTAPFWQSLGLTLLRVAAGYLCAVAAGILLAAGCWRLGWLEALLSPLRTVIRATPVTSFIILVLLWIAAGRVPVFISFLMVLPIVWTGVQEALKNVDRELEEMTWAYRFTKTRRLRYLYAPSVKPALTAACVTGLGFAWKSGIAAEVIAQPLFSVGKNLHDAKVYLETTELFAWTAAVILLSMGLEAVLKRLIRRRGEEA